jgi:hypothetical protein
VYLPGDQPIEEKRDFRGGLISILWHSCLMLDSFFFFLYISLLS